jgi:hypothetical protein
MQDEFECEVDITRLCRSVLRSLVPAHRHLRHFTTCTSHLSLRKHSAIWYGTIPHDTTKASFGFHDYGKQRFFFTKIPRTCKGSLLRIPKAMGLFQTLA